MILCGKYNPKMSYLKWTYFKSFTPIVSYYFRNEMCFHKKNDNISESGFKIPAYKDCSIFGQ